MEQCARVKSLVDHVWYCVIMPAVILGLVAFFCIASAFGESPKKLRTKFNYVLIENPYLEKMVAVRAVRETIGDINADGVVRAGIGKRVLRADPFAGARSYTVKGGGFYMFQNFFTSFFTYYRDRNLLPKKQVNFLVDAPIEVDGRNYMGGFAWLGGFWSKSFAYCNGMEVNDSGLPRFRSLVQCMRHEFYHLLCATHDSSSANIMHPDALAKYEEQRVKGNASKLPLNARAKNEILACVKYYNFRALESDQLELVE